MSPEKLCSENKIFVKFVLGSINTDLDDDDDDDDVYDVNDEDK